MNAPAHHISAAQLLTPEFLEDLTEAERLILPYLFDEVWLRPNQRISAAPWVYYGFICGRGFGKSLGISTEINRRVQAGEETHIALMAPTEERVELVQVAFLIATAPPWFRPERYKGGLVWPNGIRATAYTPEAPGRSRGDNNSLSWLCEIVDWQHTTRLEAFHNITTATRVGNAQVIWDTTSKGKNEVIQILLDLHREDPRSYPIQRGTTFDNPFLPDNYLKTECRKYSGRRYDEEILGKVFAESDGALWHQAWLDDHRVDELPNSVDLRLVSIDPALSTHRDSDETGMIVGSRDRSADVFIEDDLSGRYPPEEWGDLAVQQCADNGAAGCIVERNHAGDLPSSIISSRASNRGIRVRILNKGQRFPRRTRGVIYIREKVSSRSKEHRAGGPASETEAGRVHLVGTFPELELELTTWVPGETKSPNRLDAMAQLITELRGLDQPGPMVSSGDVTNAASLNAKLQNRLRDIGKGKIIR